MTIMQIVITDIDDPPPEPNAKLALYATTSDGAITVNVLPDGTVEGAYSVQFYAAHPATGELSVLELTESNLDTVLAVIKGHRYRTAQEAQQ